MYSLIEQISEESVWEEYLNFKKEQASISKRELKEIENYIVEKNIKVLLKKLAKAFMNFQFLKSILLIK